MNIDSHECVVSRAPFTVWRRVRWSDCDPAGVVYTGRFSEYVLSFVNLFHAELAQPLTYREWCGQMGVDTPCKAMALEFHRALWPDEEFYLCCHVPAVREHSYDLVIEAALEDGTRVFSVRFSPICIARGVRQRVAIPPTYRSALVLHAAQPSRFDGGTPAA